MNDWKKPGPHNCYEAHDVDRQADLPQSLRDPFRKMKRCPGGSPVTAADLEALLMPQAEALFFTWADGSDVDQKELVRLLIPIPDPTP